MNEWAAVACLCALSAFDPTLEAIAYVPVASVLITKAIATEIEAIACPSVTFRTTGDASVPAPPIAVVGSLVSFCGARCFMLLRNKLTDLWIRIKRQRIPDGRIFMN